MLICSYFGPKLQQLKKGYMLKTAHQDLPVPCNAKPTLDPYNSCTLRYVLTNFWFFFCISTGNKLKELPVCLCNLQRLHVLNICKNHITRLPVELCQIRTLETLVMTPGDMVYPPKGMRQEQRCASPVVVVCQMREVILSGWSLCCPSKRVAVGRTRSVDLYSLWLELSRVASRPAWAPGWPRLLLHHHWSRPWPLQLLVFLCHCRCLWWWHRSCNEVLVLRYRMIAENLQLFTFLVRMILSVNTALSCGSFAIITRHFVRQNCTKTVWWWCSSRPIASLCSGGGEASYCAESGPFCEHWRCPPARGFEGVLPQNILNFWHHEGSFHAL